MNILEIKNINKENVEKLEKELNIKLTAEKENSTVNGFINTHQENGQLITEMVLYDKNEPSNYQEGVYNNRHWFSGHKSSLKAVNSDKTTDKIKKLSEKGQ